MRDRFAVKIGQRYIAIATCSALLCLPGCEGPEIEIHETPIDVAGETVGTGKVARVDDIVCIDYRILTPDGSEFMKADDFTFTLGRGAVIAGFDDAIPGMRVGGKRVIKCPPHKHWGRAGYGDGEVPPNTTLTLHIKLNSIE